MIKLIAFITVICFTGAAKSGYDYASQKAHIICNQSRIIKKDLDALSVSLPDQDKYDEARTRIRRVKRKAKRLNNKLNKLCSI